VLAETSETTVMNRFSKNRPAGTVGAERGPWFPARQGGNIAVALAIVAGVAGGCGGGNKSSPPTPASSSSSQSSSQASTTASAWAGSFCGYAQAWKTSLQHAAATLKSSHTRGGATAALDTAKSATLLFSNQLSALGAPPGAGAQQATQQLRVYGQRLKYSNQNLQGEFNGSSSTTSQLTQKIRNVRGTLLVMVGQLQQAYGYVTTAHVSSQLKQALTSNSTCRAVFSKTQG
jgi:hypothetical protein